MSEKRIIFNKKYLAKVFSLSLLLMIFVTGCGRKADETSDRDKKTTEAVTEATTGENADAGADRVDEDSKMNSSSTAKTASDKSFELVAGKTFKVVGSVFALEWSDEVTINDDGSFDLGITWLFCSFGRTLSNRCGFGAAALCGPRGLSLRGRSS